MSVKKMNLVTIVIFVHLLMFMVRGNLDLSPDEEADGKKQWEKYCGARNDVEFSKRVTCSEMDGKIYYFEPEPNMFVGSTNLREICRSKFSYNPGADMVSIDSCDEYKRFTGVVDGFVKKNEFNKPIKVYTSGYFSPSLAEGGKSGVYRWMKSNKQATEFFENAPKCMDWDEGEPTTPDYPLKLLTIEAKESNIRSKFIPWKYPQFSPTDGYLMCELSVPGNKVVPPPQPVPEKPDEPKPPEDPGKQPEIKPGGKTEEEDNPADIPDDEQESREEIGKFFQGLKDELSKVNAPVIEVTQQLADKLSTPNFSINDQTHLNQVIELTGELDEKIEEKMPSAEDPLIWRYNFTKKICKVYADVLQPRNEKAWRPLKQEKRLKDCQSIISRTENLGIKLACEMKDPGNLLIDVNDIGLETFSYDPDTIALKSFIFPSNITRSKRITNSHILFPKGLNISGIPKACRNQKPVALGTIHKKLIEKMNTNNAFTPIASEMIAFSFGSEITDIQVDVNLVHNQRKIRGDVPICAFWDTNSLTWNTTGCWVDNYNSSLSHTVCRCNHLTNFAVLMDISGRQTNSSAKDILSTVGLSLSVLCLIVTNFLLLFVPSLKSRRTTITINISICMLVGNLVTLFGLESTENETSCRLISALLLYSLAALFSWMFLEGYFLYQMIIVVFRGSGYLDTKWLYLIGYGLPTVWTFSAVLILGFEGLYHPNSYYCWIANPFYPERMWVFAGPVVFILFFNMAIFAKSFHVAFISNMNKGSVNRKAGDGSQKNSIIRWFKGWLSLFVLLGLTWLIGFFQFESSSELASYIFIIMNSFQGVFIFLFEIVTNSKARPAVIKALSGKLSSEYLRSSKTTNSTNPYSTSNSRTGRSVISNDKKNGIFTNSSRIKMNNSDSYELK